MEVRPAGPEDFDAVTALLAELGRPAAAQRGVYDAQIADAHARHLVAVDEAGAAIGFCSLHLRSRLNQPTLEAWIPDLIVTAAARGTGAGYALLAEAQRIACAEGCHQLVLESGHARERAHAFYEQAGLEHTGRAYGVRLTP